jgi:hypothetical protein
MYDNCQEMFRNVKLMIPKYLLEQLDSQNEELEAVAPVGNSEIRGIASATTVVPFKSTS